MAWHKITTGTKVYVLDPEQLILRDHDDGHQLTPAEIVDGWRRIGQVDRLPPSDDPTDTALGR